SVEYVYEWIRQENREIQVKFYAIRKYLKAMIEAVAQRDLYQQLKNKAEEKQKSENVELQNVVSGKTTIRTLFSKITKKSKEESISIIEQTIKKVFCNVIDLI